MLTVDTIGGASADQEPPVLNSKVSFNLGVNKLTKVLAVNMFKLLMVIIGPMNDE